MLWLRRLFKAVRNSPPPAPAARDLAEPAALLDFLNAQNDPVAFPSVERVMQRTFSLYRRIGTSATRQAEIKQLSSHPELAVAFLFHGDGLIREAALETLASANAQPIAVYGVILRLNDWVPMVRLAARNAFTRCLSQSSPSVLAPAVWVALLNARDWRRWPEGYAGFVDEVMKHQGLVNLLVARLLRESRGGTGLVFEAMCRSPEMDHFLMQIAVSAQQPHLRAGALTVLAAAKVVWPTGRLKKVWVDKSRGSYKLVQDYGSRPLTIDVDLATLLQKALADRSAAVIAKALDALTVHRHDPRLREVIAQCLEDLAIDQRLRIRTRLVYLKEQMPTSS